MACNGGKPTTVNSGAPQGRDPASAERVELEGKKREREACVRCVKICPLSGTECREDCAWNTDKGCAVALLPRKLEDVSYEIRDIDVTVDTSD